MSKIEVIRKDNISNIDIVYRAVDGLRSESLLWLDKSKISESITKYQGNITDIEISKVLPDTLKIVVGSARGLFLTAYKGTSYLVTSNGVFVPYELEEGVPFLEVHTDAEYDLSIVAYKQILHPEYVQAANYLIQKLQDNLLTISIERLDYYVEERELHVSLKDGPILLFDVFGSLDDQIKKLLIYDKEQTPIMRAGLVYMDLRVPGKIFSCTTEQEYQCYANLKRIYTKD
ncbi:MAG: FtsQ-type POTRA domain-containing protein [Candidatus Peribacteria bacterium]|nr:MAG: FtsQ-type POTRA domain-containing protein [Candidatus Peribacteria bacterium]